MFRNNHYHEWSLNGLLLYLRDETLLVSATEDGEIFLWKLDNSYSLQSTVKGGFIQIKIILRLYTNTESLCRTQCKD